MSAGAIWVLELVKKVFGLLPLRDWLWIGLVIALIALHLDLCHRDVVKAVAAVKAEAAKKQAESDTTANTRFDKLAEQTAKEQVAASQAHQQSEDQHAKDLAALHARQAEYMGTLLLAAVPDVPRDYLLFRADAATFANGGSPAAARRPEQIAPESSGVSFGSLAEADVAQADAYRSAVDWGRQWQAAAQRLEHQCKSEINILMGVNP